MTDVTWNGKIHKAADIFPYMDDENFALLVESVRQNGVREPITLAPDGTLLDGRNRALAAQEAGITAPTLVNNGDPIALARDANLRRRHLPTGQQAMIEAVLLNMEGKRKNGRWDRGSIANRKSPVTPGWETALQRAGTILDHSDQDDLINEVIDGSMALDAAYREAVKRKTQKGTVVKVRSRTVAAPAARPTFNSVNENIGWAHWSWNPVTGCEHGCPYCYARELSESLQRKHTPGYDQGFTPAFHEYRLTAPVDTTFPIDSEDPRDRRVFVCSMADLFGRWVPQEWIDKVFTACRAAPQWEYLFLTKFPSRYAKLSFPPDAWAGTSVDTQKRVTTAMQSMAKVKAKVRWLSIEPLLEPLTFKDLSMFNLIVIGAQTRVSATTEFPASPEVAPDFDWVASLVAQARRDGCAVYLKENLIGERHSQAPGMALPQELPS